MPIQCQNLLVETLGIANWHESNVDSSIQHRILLSLLFLVVFCFFKCLNFILWPTTCVSLQWNSFGLLTPYFFKVIRPQISFKFGINFPLRSFYHVSGGPISCTKFAIATQIELFKVEVGIRTYKMRSPVGGWWRVIYKCVLGSQDTQTLSF